MTSYYNVGRDRRGYAYVDIPSDLDDLDSQLDFIREAVAEHGMEDPRIEAVPVPYVDEPPELAVVGHVTLSESTYRAWCLKHGREYRPPN